MVLNVCEKGVFSVNNFKVGWTCQHYRYMLYTISGCKGHFDIIVFGIIFSLSRVHDTENITFFRSTMVVLRRHPRMVVQSDADLPRNPTQIFCTADADLSC